MSTGFMFCETAEAGGKLPWHIRMRVRTDDNDRSVFLIADSPALCGVQVAWDRMPELDSSMRCCVECSMRFLGKAGLFVQMLIELNVPIEQLDSSKLVPIALLASQFICIADESVRTKKMQEALAMFAD